MTDSDVINIVENVKVSVRYYKRWRKTKDFFIRDSGRWGPKWLHWIILRAAINCGMIGNGISYENISKVTVIRIQKKDIISKISAAVINYINEGFDEKNLVVYIGRDQFDEMIHNFNSFLTIVSMPIGKDGHLTVLGIRVILVNTMNGLVVVPHPNSVRTY